MKLTHKKPTIRFRIAASFLIFGLFSSLLTVFFFCGLPAKLAVFIFVPVLIACSLLFSCRLVGCLQKDLTRLRAYLSAQEANSAASARRLELSTSDMDEISSQFHQVIRKLQGYHKDLSKSRSLSERQRKNVAETLTNFMYYFAHMIRTPLNAVRWSVESLKNEEAGAVTAKQREMLDTIERATVSLAGVASELQDTLTVVKGNRLRAKSETCDLLSLMDEAAGRFAVPARRRRLELIWEHPENEANLMHSDCTQLQRALGFLLENAVRYSLEGQKIVLAVESLSRRPPASQKRALSLPASVRKAGLVVSVKDQGIGIPRNEIIRVFEPFYRASNARQHWVDAKGIGLTLAQAIAQQHGGQIWLKSRLNRGTTAFLFLPYKK